MPKKSQKGRLGPVSPECRKSAEKVKKVPKKCRLVTPNPLHTRQKYEQTSGQNMTPNASKQGKFGSLGAICLFIFLPCMWGLGFQKESPSTVGTEILN